MGESSSLRREAGWRHRAHPADTRCGIMASCLTSLIMSQADGFVHDVPPALAMEVESCDISHAYLLTGARSLALIVLLLPSRLAHAGQCGAVHMVRS